jgi:hypothetical protein
MDARDVEVDGHGVWQVTAMVRYGSSGSSVPGVRLKLLMKTTTSGGGVAAGLKMAAEALAMKVSVEDASRLYPRSILYQLILLDHLAV